MRRHLARGGRLGSKCIQVEHLAEYAESCIWRTEVEEEAANAEREVSNLQGRSRARCTGAYPLCKLVWPGQANRDQLDVEHEHYESLKKDPGALGSRSAS